MKKLLIIATHCFLTILMFSSYKSQAQNIDLSKIEAGSYDGTWWNRTPIRLIQTNFPSIYANMNVDDYVQSLVDASANVVLFNTGGITANYQTLLPYEYKNPYMGNRDLVRELIKKCHKKGIKFIARFDFSRVHPSIAEKKPEWLYVGNSGKNQIFNNMVSTCLNGDYQQKYAFEILKEVIKNYDIDGIFFNNLSYTGWTYDGKSDGNCQCESCKRRFFEETKFEFPKERSDPGFKLYKEFKETTEKEINNKVAEFIKKQNPDLIVYNYSDLGTSWIATETGVEATGNQADVYFASRTVKSSLGTFKNKTPLNVVNGPKAISYRNIINPPSLLSTFVIEEMLHGAPLGFNVLGTLVSYEDRAFFPILNKLYGFHKTYEKLFTNLQSVSHVAVIDNGGEYFSKDLEFQGILELLSQEHIMYDVIHHDHLTSSMLPRKLSEYDALILCNLEDIDEKDIALLDNYVSNGGKLLVTGATSTKNGNGEPMNKIRLQSLGVEPEYEVFPQAGATYLKVSENDKQIMGQSKEFSLMMMNSAFLKCKVKEGAQGYMRLLPSNMFGPAEVTWYSESEITNYPGAIANNFGKGKTTYIPWKIGTQYKQMGNYAQRSLFLGALKNLLQVESSLETNASPLIEITHLANRNGAFEWVGMINHSGLINNSVRETVGIHNTNIRFKPQKPVKEIKLLKAGITINFKEKSGWIECDIPEINDFEMLLCTYK